MLNLSSKNVFAGVLCYNKQYRNLLDGSIEFSLEPFVVIPDVMGGLSLFSQSASETEWTKDHKVLDARQQLVM